MGCYIISFEVRTEETRKKVRERLKTYGGYCPINRTCWAITTADKKATDIRDNIAEVLSPGDRVFVIRSGTEAAWRNAFGKGYSEWLKKYL